AVVGDEDLAGEACALERPARLPDASGQRLRFVQTGHENRQLQRVFGNVHGFGRDSFEYIGNPSRVSSSAVSSRRRPGRTASSSRSLGCNRLAKTTLGSFSRNGSLRTRSCAYQPLLGSIATTDPFRLWM